MAKLFEDDVDTREMIAHALKEFGASVAQASSARDALREFVTVRPDVLISDIAKPDTDGYQLLTLIQAQTQQPLPAVALTAYTTGSEKERALHSGFPHA